MLRKLTAGDERVLCDAAVFSEILSAGKSRLMAAVCVMLFPSGII